jgi:hypothetical protein
MQLLRHTPRFESSQSPSVHVEELKEKVSVRGAVTHVGRPNVKFNCSFLNFRCQVQTPLHEEQLCA